MTIEALDHKLNKVITHYTMRIADQYSDSNEPLTRKDALEIAKETSDHLALFKQEILRFLKDKENIEE
ncbi:MAG: hypothetical protein IKN12_10455 [Selenomonadaceae bacterium]|nr:hypothetical protein [Selenomonadaceae bacterium]MBR3723163.1 hypothetical protein [Selenomonadaceae bacterium]